VSPPLCASEPGWRSIGLRGGVNDNRNDENLGGPVQFTSHIGVNLNFTRHFTMGYRLQHMSNGVLYDSNPGLNLHMIEVGYRF
jgi:hypothetical protein